MIDTQLLIVRHFQAQDGDALFAYLSNPLIYRFEPGEPLALKQAKALAVERSQGSDFWAVVLKSANTMVGHLYFKQIEPPKFFTWELGYIFNPAFQNQGYASESARALVHYGFQHFGIHRVVARCNPENIASWKVMAKIGMTREGHFRKNACFHHDATGAPLWTDSYEYAILEEDVKIPPDCLLGQGERPNAPPSP
jgi:RimJ/RimL family protein N-acetyltransferase